MATKASAKKKPTTKPKTGSSSTTMKKTSAPAVRVEKPASVQIEVEPVRPKETAKEREERERRRDALYQMLMTKRLTVTVIVSDPVAPSSSVTVTLKTKVAGPVTSGATNDAVAVPESKIVTAGPNSCAQL